MEVKIIKFNNEFFQLVRADYSKNTLVFKQLKESELPFVVETGPNEYKYVYENPYIRKYRKALEQANLI